MVATRTAEAISSEERAPYRAGEFAVMVDTREQKPWLFAIDVPMVATTLPAGDYAPVDCGLECVIERKSLDDFVSSVTVDPARFRRELDVLKTYKFAAVIIETTEKKIRGKEYFASGAQQRPAIMGGGLGERRPNVKPEQILDLIARISLDLVPVFYGENRHYSAAFALRLMRRFWLKKGGGK